MPSPASPPVCFLDHVRQAQEQRVVDRGLRPLGDRHELTVLDGVELAGRIHDVDPRARLGLAVDVGAVRQLPVDALLARPRA